MVVADGRGHNGGCARGDVDAAGGSRRGNHVDAGPNPERRPAGPLRKASASAGDDRFGRAGSAGAGPSLHDDRGHAAGDEPTSKPRQKEIPDLDIVSTLFPGAPNRQRATPTNRVSNPPLNQPARCFRFYLSRCSLPCSSTFRRRTCPGRRLGRASNCSSGKAVRQQHRGTREPPLVTVTPTPPNSRPRHRWRWRCWSPPRNSHQFLRQRSCRPHRRWYRLGSP